MNFKITPNTHSILTLECSVKENDERVIYKQQRGNIKHDYKDRREGKAQLFIK